MGDFQYKKKEATAATPTTPPLAITFTGATVNYDGNVINGIPFGTKWGTSIRDLARTFTNLTGLSKVRFTLNFMALGTLNNTITLTPQYSLNSGVSWTTLGVPITLTLSGAVDNGTLDTGWGGLPALAAVDNVMLRINPTYSAGEGMGDDVYFVLSVLQFEV